MTTVNNSSSSDLSLNISDQVTWLGWSVGFGLVWLAAGNNTLGNMITLILLGGIIYLGSRIDLGSLLVKT
jgi:hypothetical protein